LSPEYVSEVLQCLTRRNIKAFLLRKTSIVNFPYLFEKSLESLRHLELEGEGNLLVRHIQLK
jgi:hypothetical protein